MSVWKRFSLEQRQEYIKYLQVYGALTNLFRQKKGNIIPYLDSKYQETVFAKSFDSKIVDIGNTPHDVLSVFDNKRIGIGLKTWMGSQPSFQKVMQLKRYQRELNKYRNNLDDLAFKISEIRNERLLSDYQRLGLISDENIYHYVTRDKKLFTINECAYPLIELTKLKILNISKSSFTWHDNYNEYKYTFGDSQIWQKFDPSKLGTLVLDKFNIEIIEDPFSFLLKAYTDSFDKISLADENIVEAFLPLYSYRSKDVEDKSGLNAWRAAPKSKGSSIPRPLNEVYIPIPREFHKKHPDFFTSDIFKFEKDIKKYQGKKTNKPKISFHLLLPNGKKIPALITQDNFKSLQSGSMTEVDENGKRFGQSALGQWLLIDVLGLKERKKVTRNWLIKKGTDSVRLWRNKDDYSLFNIDFAPVGAFEAFMNDLPIPEDDDDILIEDLN